MIVQVYTILLFIIFYFGVFQKKIEIRAFSVLTFMLMSIVLRLSVDINTNKDFWSYYNLYRIEEPNYWWKYITEEPYLYLLHSFFSYFYDVKMDVFNAMYIFNYAIVTLFFAWLMVARGISVWKKVLFFSMYYFLFSYTLLRNGIPYSIFGYFIYKIYRGRTTKWIYITPFMHISSAAPILLVFHKHRKYMLYLLSISTFLLVIIFIGGTILNRPEFALISYKIDAYGSMQGGVSIFHYIYFAIISVFCFISWKFTKKRFWNPVIATALSFYLIGFLINPIVGFRFSPYLMMGLLFMNVDTSKYQKLNEIMNLGALVLVGYFVFTLYDTHFFQ